MVERRKRKVVALCLLLLLAVARVEALSSRRILQELGFSEDEEEESAEDKAFEARLDAEYDAVLAGSGPDGALAFNVTSVEDEAQAEADGEESESKLTDFIMQMGDDSADNHSPEEAPNVWSSVFNTTDEAFAGASEENSAEDIEDGDDDGEDEEEVEEEDMDDEDSSMAITSDLYSNEFTFLSAIDQMTTDDADFFEKPPNVTTTSSDILLDIHLSPASPPPAPPPISKRLAALLARNSSLTADGGKCKIRDECIPGRLCVNGKCACPILPGLTAYSQEGCEYDPATHRKKGAEKWCIRPIDSFPSRNNRPGKRYVLEGARRRPELDLPYLADWSTCAVVGSGGEMKVRQYGKEIDAHTAVIRFNDAPAGGEHAKAVGSKTTLRVQNIEYCGFRQGKKEILVHYTLPRRGMCKRALELSNLFLDYEFGYFRRVLGRRGSSKMGLSKEPNGGERKLSAGFMGVALAVHLCGSVDIYGFSESADHYYKKTHRSKTTNKFDNRHNWVYERECLRVLKHNGMVNVKVRDKRQKKKGRD
eukprot:jgi/Chlat1/1487/Chrsp12S02025